MFFFFFSSRRRHTRSTRDWSSDVCSSDLFNCASVEDLYVAVGQGLVTGRAVANAAFPQPQEAKSKVVSLARARRKRSEERRVGKECTAGGWPSSETKQR